MDHPEFLTPAEWAQVRRCSVRTLGRERVNRIGCPYVRLGNRILYRRADIDSYIAERLNGTFTGLNELPRRHRRSRKVEGAEAAAS
jgi:hypothetical protein